MDVILLGAPGAGKGTQASILETHTGLTHVASGDLFRAALREGTELGTLAKSYMDRGELVPDEVVIRMIVERIARPDCARGVIFDGFPRTREQAGALERELALHHRWIDAAVYLHVPREMLVRRLSGRQTCRDCGAVHNLYYFPPKRPNICDICEGSLFQRSDDTAETVQHRLEVYFVQTMPLIEYYRERGTLIEVDGRHDIAHVTKHMIDSLGLRQRAVAA